MDCANRLRRRYNNHSVSSSGISVFEIALLTSTILLLTTSETAGKSTNLRDPRLELKTRNSCTMLYVYNYDLTTNRVNIEDAVNCTVEGGHLVKTANGLKPVTMVDLKCSPHLTVKKKPKFLGMSESDIMQTLSTCNVTYDVEGNLTCRNRFVKNSNTILLRLKNHDTAVVRLVSNITMKKLLELVEGYANSTFNKYTGRLYKVSDNGVKKEAIVRLSYNFSNSEEFDQTKLVNYVNELTIYLSKEMNISLTHDVRSTRSCLPVFEGNFSWPLTSVGHIILPENPCFDVNNNPMPRRKCLGDFFEGAYWDVLPERPHWCSENGTKSTELFNIVNTLYRKNSLDNLQAELSQISELSPVEVYFVSELLRKTAEEISTEGLYLNISAVVSVVDAILRAGSKKIKMADDAYGSSGSLLDSINKLVAATTSPFPIPVSMPSFSAFAATAGTGILGFTFTKHESQKDMDKMILLDKHNNENQLVDSGSSIKMYLEGHGDKYVIIATLFEDESLFNAAKTSTMKLEGPIIGVKLIQREGLENSENPEPVLITIKFNIGNGANINRLCMSWEPSRDGGWSSAACRRVGTMADIFTCTVPITMDLYFTIISDVKSEIVPLSETQLSILPMKYNVGALLLIYNSILTKLTDINCYVNWKENDTVQPVSFEHISELNYGIFKNKKLNLLKITNYTEGYLQCKKIYSTSNKILLLFPNTATLSLTVPVSINAQDAILKYTKENFLDLHFTKIFLNNETAKEDFRVVQYTEKNHLDFIASLKYMFQELKDSHNLTLIHIMSNRFCLSHDDGEFTWPNTKLNHVATPINPCLDKYGAPIPARHCLGDYVNGMYWEPEPIRPYPCIKPSGQAERLQNLVTKHTKNDTVEELLRTISEDSASSVIKASLLTTMLKKVSVPSLETAKPNISSIAKIVNAIIAAKTESKNESITTSSEDILTSIEKLLEKCSTDKPLAVVTDHFSAMVAGPGSAFRGFFESKKLDDEAQSSIEPISSETSVEDIITRSSSTGAFLMDPLDDVGLTFTIFDDGTLFGDDKELELASPVVGLKMFGNEENNEEVDSQNCSVLLLFDKDDSDSGRRRNCYFWNTKENKWSKNGCSRVYSCNLPGEIPADKDACLCTHLTHFAMLVSTVAHEEDNLLGMVTLVGCALSLASLFGIFLIAIFSPEWRRGASRKVQMSLSASLALLMASYLTVATMGECPPCMVSCVALGALVHYSVLASFSWMLVAAMLQVFRLTPSIAMDAKRRADTYLVLKTSVFGWGIPMIPVAITLCSGTDQYVRRQNSALCYPTGRAFYAAVLCPVTLSITLNTIVFIWLMYMLFCNKFKEMRVHQKAKHNQEVRRYFSALFLFCLLGITCISGIAVEVTVASKSMSKFLSYAFCVTATLQGTSLFIFFVVCERKAGSKMCKAFPTPKRIQNAHVSRGDFSFATFKATTASDLKK